MGQGNTTKLFVHDRSWYEPVRPPLSSASVLPFVHYVVREKGKVEIGMAACALCHLRVLPDRSVLKRCRHPTRIPDLIGVENRAYLDHTGLQVHRNIGDLMCYAALNRGGDDVANFGGFVPMAHLLGDQKLTPELGDRYIVTSNSMHERCIYIRRVRRRIQTTRIRERAGAVASS